MHDLWPFLICSTNTVKFGWNLFIKKSFFNKIENWLAGLKQTSPFKHKVYGRTIRFPNSWRYGKDLTVYFQNISYRPPHNKSTTYFKIFIFCFIQKGSSNVRMYNRIMHLRLGFSGSQAGLPWRRYRIDDKPSSSTGWYHWECKDGSDGGWAPSKGAAREAGRNGCWLRSVVSVTLTLLAFAAVYIFWLLNSS